jgi:Tfp pilus assembly protein PilV
MKQRAELRGRRADGPTRHAFTGLTLVEVLMSMLVMSIGILAIIGLLPLAFVRAVQATNLTNGTIHRFNAESQIYLDQADLEYVFPNWQPNTAYVQGAATTGGPQPAPPSIVLAGGTSNVRFRCTTTGTSGATAPTWNSIVGQTTTESTGVTWITEDQSHYVIDPLGWNTLAASGGTLQGALGNDRGTIGLIGASPSGTAIERFNGGINASIDGGAATAADAHSIALAALRVMLPDSWAEQARGAATNVTPSTVQLANVDLSGVQYFGVSAPTNGGPGPFPTIASRVVLLNPTAPATAGKSSQARLITNITVANSPLVSTITWGGTAGNATANNDPLPTGFTPSQVRVETQDRRYTWMLTVRRASSGLPNVDVTVFFNRTFSVDDEQTYPSSVVSQTQFTINYGSLPTPPALPPKPFAKKGGFLFDVTYGRWYRVTNVTDNGTQMTLTVDRARPSTDGNTFTAVFMRGVVSVYSFPLKS